MKVRNIILIVALLLLAISFAQASVPPNNPETTLGLWHKTTLESAGCAADDESAGFIANEGVTNTGAGGRSAIVGGDFNGTSSGNTHKFTGHVQDNATGQYYAKNRYFTTQLGRWTQPEPLLKGVPGKRFLYNPQRLNPYVYCINNPLFRIDPDGLTDITIQIDRTTETDNSTIGNFHIQGTDIRGNTLELPDNNNQRNISRIPAGTYNATTETQRTRGQVLRVNDVPGRSGVLVHRGNVPAHTHGCILPGTSTGTDRVNNSTEAMRQINEHINTVTEQDQQNNEQTNVIIQINDPQMVAPELNIRQPENNYALPEP